MSFDAVVGHAREIQRLRRQLAADRLPHACLLHGGEGIGKYHVAWRIGLARLCSARPEDACGDCPDCRLGLAGNHPDLHPLDDAEAVTLQIDQVRDLIALSRRKPYRSAGRTFIIRDAHRLTDQAQNALLKTLEEPPAGCVLILTSHRPEGLLRTIRSRCQEVRFRPLSMPETTAVLERTDCPGERVALLARISGGSPGKALALDAGGFLELRDALLTLVAQEAEDPLGVAAAVYERVKTGETGVRFRAQILVEMWVSVLRDLLAVRAGASEEIVWHRDIGARLESVAAGRSIRDLESRAAAACSALASLAVNASPDLVLSDLALQLV